MTYNDLEELHFIVPLTNLPSILQRGILSHRLAGEVEHLSIANEEVQSRRAKKRVPGGDFLHDYVNLYVNARNSMLYKLCVVENRTDDLCILRIDKSTIQGEGVVISDANAAADDQNVGFWPFPTGLQKLNSNLVFARYWNDPDEIVKARKKRAQHAEVLVPTSVDAGMIVGGYVARESVRDQLKLMNTQLNFTVKPYLFFA